MKVYEALARGFAEEGTSAVFGMMGDANQHWINAMTRLGTSVYEVRHEGPGLAMAAGWATINGSPGVCTTTCGPGVTQLATSMVVASRSRVPLIAFCGDTRWGDEETDNLFDQARFAAALECEFVRLTSPETAFNAVRKAFYIARLESRPVMLSAPKDLQLALFDETETYIRSTALIANDFVQPSSEVMNAAANIIEQSQRVVLIVGRGAIRSGARDAVLKVADRTGALLATSLVAMNWLQDASDFHAGISGLFATRTATELLQEADCVIAVGASLNSYTTVHGYLYPNAKFIHIDCKSQLLMGSGYRADCYVQSDARKGLEELDRLLEERLINRTGYRTREVKERLESALEDPAVFEIEPGTLDPRDACRVLDEVIPKDFGLVISGRHASRFAIMLCHSSRPFTYINKTFGGMGKGMPAVIGASIASGRPTALIEGDAGFMMHLAEFETAVRYSLPVFVAVLNDQALGAELHHATDDKELDPELTRISTPDLGSVGVALGGRGFLVRTADELRHATAEFVKHPGPMVVDIRISQNVVAIQNRRLSGKDA